MYAIALFPCTIMTFKKGYKTDIFGKVATLIYIAIFEFFEGTRKSMLPRPLLPTVSLRLNFKFSRYTVWCTILQKSTQAFISGIERDKIRQDRTRKQDSIIMKQDAVSKSNVNKTQQKQFKREQLNPGPWLLLIRAKHSPADDTKILTHANT